MTRVLNLGARPLLALGAWTGTVRTTTQELTGKGVTISALLDAAGPLPAATHGTILAADDDYAASIPLGRLRANGILLLSNSIGEPLSAAQGGPFRVVVPDGMTLCWNVKGATGLDVTSGPVPDSIPDTPPH